MTFSFSSGIASTDSTIFWNIVLFLKDEKAVRLFLIVLEKTQLLLYILITLNISYLLEVEGKISGNYANFKQMLHRLKLTLLKILEDIQGL